MHQKGHIGLSMIVYAPIAFTLLSVGLDGLAVIGAFSMIPLSMIPDKDMEFDFLTHRGFTHTIWFGIITGVVYGGFALYAFWDYSPKRLIGVVVFAFIVGFLVVTSHILGDALTPMGIRPFRPIDDSKYTLNLFLASNETANDTFLGAGVVVLTFVFSIGWGLYELSALQTIVLGTVLYMIPLGLVVSLYLFSSPARTIVWE